jgi:hypothetical protein
VKDTAKFMSACETAANDPQWSVREAAMFAVATLAEKTDADKAMWDATMRFAAGRLDDACWLVRMVAPQAVVQIAGAGSKCDAANAALDPWLLLTEDHPDYDVDFRDEVIAAKRQLDGIGPFGIDPSTGLLQR